MADSKDYTGIAQSTLDCLKTDLRSMGIEPPQGDSGTIEYQGVKLSVSYSAIVAGVKPGSAAHRVAHDAGPSPHRDPLQIAVDFMNPKELHQDQGSQQACGARARKHKECAVSGVPADVGLEEMDDFRTTQRR
jgi:hypothetical protein